MMWKWRHENKGHGIDTMTLDWSIATEDRQHHHLVILQTQAADNLDGCGSRRSVRANI